MLPLFLLLLTGLYMFVLPSCRQVERRATRRSIVATTMARMSAKSPKVVRKATAKQVTAKPGLLSGRRLGEESQPTARRTNASRPVRIAWGRFGTCLVQRLSRASQVYWPAPSWLFFTKPGRRTAPLVATKDEGDCAARACLARTHAHGAHRRPTLWHRVWPGRSYAIVLVRPCLSYRILTSIGETAGVRCRSHAAKL